MLKKKIRAPRSSQTSPYKAQESGTENLQVDILNVFVQLCFGVMGWELESVRDLGIHFDSVTHLYM